jgi:hypothetical protein
MSSEKQNKRGADDRDGRLREIPQAAAIAKKESDQGVSAASLTPESLASDEACRAQEKFHVQDSDVVRRRKQIELARLLAKIRRGEAGYDAIDKFFHKRNGSGSESNA